MKLHRCACRVFIGFVSTDIGDKTIAEKKGAYLGEKVVFGPQEVASLFLLWLFANEVCSDP